MPISNHNKWSYDRLHNKKLIIHHQISPKTPHHKQIMTWSLIDQFIIKYNPTNLPYKKVNNYWNNYISQSNLYKINYIINYNNINLKFNKTTSFISIKANSCLNSKLGFTASKYTNILNLKFSHLPHRNIKSVTTKSVITLFKISIIWNKLLVRHSNQTEIIYIKYLQFKIYRSFANILIPKPQTHKFL